MAPVKRSKKPSEGWIYDQVFDAILEQRLLPDTKLTEKVCAMFSASARPYPQGLLRLSLDKVVEHHRTAVQSSAPEGEVREIAEARRLLETASSPSGTNARRRMPMS